MKNLRILILVIACTVFYGATACERGAGGSPDIPVPTVGGGSAAGPAGTASETELIQQTEEQILNCLAPPPSLPAGAVCNPCLRYAAGADLVASINFDGWTTDNAIISALRTNQEMSQVWDRFVEYKPVHACLVVKFKTGPQPECNPDVPNFNMTEMDCFIQKNINDLMLVGTYENEVRTGDVFARLTQEITGLTQGVDPADGIGDSDFSAILKFERPPWTEKNIYIARMLAPASQIAIGMAARMRDAIAPPAGCPASLLATVMNSLRAANIKAAGVIAGERFLGKIPLAVTDADYAAGFAFNLGGEKAFADLKVFRADRVELLDPEFELLAALRPDAIENSWFAKVFKNMKTEEVPPENDMCGGDCTGPCHALGPRPCSELSTREECIQYYGLDWQMNAHNCAWGKDDKGALRCFWYGSDDENTCALENSGENAPAEDPSELIKQIPLSPNMDVDNMIK